MNDVVKIGRVGKGQLVTLVDYGSDCYEYKMTKSVRPKIIQFYHFFYNKYVTVKTTKKLGT